MHVHAESEEATCRTLAFSLCRQLSGIAVPGSMVVSESLFSPLNRYFDENTSAKKVTRSTKNARNPTIANAKSKKLVTGEVLE